MRIALPTGEHHGWGICGDRLRSELGKLPPIPDNVTLHAINGPDFFALRPEDWNQYNFGICFTEHHLVAKQHIDRANWYDGIIAGSEWNADYLKRYGVNNVSFFTQGIDHNFFQFKQRERDGRFIVFSGGKAEYRKGTDLVISTMKAVMDRHPDVWLSASWENPWPATMDSLTESSIIYVKRNTCRETLLATLQANGIDMRRVILHPLLAHRCMAGIYHDSDVGLFPNRCEAGTNLVLMEYMACGRAVLATAAHGHLDVLPQGDTQRLEDLLPEGLSQHGWPEPLPSEMLDKLEHLYDMDRGGHDPGEENAAWSQQFSWQRAAKEVHSAIQYWLEHGTHRDTQPGVVFGDFANGLS